MRTPAQPSKRQPNTANTVAKTIALSISSASLNLCEACKRDHLNTPLMPPPVVGLGSRSLLQRMPRFDGAWEADFGAELGGLGVLLLRRGQALGCDNQYFYAGSYTIAADGSIQARIKVEHYAGQGHPNSNVRPSVSYIASLQGMVVDNRVQLNGIVNGDPERTLTITLTRLMPTTEGA